MTCSIAIMGLCSWGFGPTIHRALLQWLGPAPNQYWQYYNHYNLSSCKHVYVDLGLPAVTSLDAFIKAGALDASEIGRMAKAVRANRNRKVSREV